MSLLIPKNTSPNTDSLEQLNHEIAHAFHHRPVRDLAWALLSPAFFVELPDVNNEWLSPLWQDDALMPWLFELDTHIEPLSAHLKDQRATRLGIYFEQLLSFYFSHYPRFALLAKNLQANSEKRTIGEYDFIVWDKQDQQHYHIEVAIKFYIGAPNEMMPVALNIPKNTPKYNWHCWIGPNKKDSLGIKLNHLLHHQLCLSQTDAGKAALETIGLTADQLKPKLLLTGRLYLPQPFVENKQAATINLPAFGQYKIPFIQRWHDKNILIDSLICDVAEAKGRKNLEGKSYTILPRQLWMSALTEKDMENNSLETLSAEALLALLQNSVDAEMPLHIAQITPQKNRSTTQTSTSLTLVEKQRFFVL
jgi:hypothetical protein